MEEKQSQEIDMLNIIDKAKCAALQCAELLGSLFTRVIRLTYRYKILFLITMVAAVALSYYMTSGNHKVYRADMSLKLNAGTSYTVADMMNELNDFIKHDDDEGLAEALKIDRETAKGITFVESYYYIAINQDSTRSIIDFSESYDIDDTLNTRVKDKIVVSLGLKDRSKFGKMQETLTTYINNNEFLKILHQKRLSNLQQRENIIECDLKRLDSLQNKQFFQNEKTEVYLSNRTEIRSGKQDLFYNDKQNLLDKKEKLENELSANENVVTVITPFHPSAVSHNSFLLKTVIYCILFYLLFIVLTAAFKNKKKIMAYLKEDK